MYAALGTLTADCASHSSGERSFRLNFGSCYDIALGQSAENGMIWETTAGRQAEAFIWAGDIVYGDENGQPATVEYLQELYQRTADIPQYKAFVDYVGQDNIVGTWGN